MTGGFILSVGLILLAITAVLVLKPPRWP